MDYEKEYKSLVAKVKKAHQFAQTDSTKSVLEDILPELRESEDERIRKEIVEHIKDQIHSFISPPDCRDKDEEEELAKYKSWLAYLEKQKDIDKMIIVSPEVWEDAIADAYENGKKDGEKQKEQKPAVSEHDAYELLSKKGYAVIEREVYNELCEKAEQKPDNKCKGCNNVKGCINCVDGSEWAHIEEIEQKPAWSEEDEKMRNLAIEWAETMYGQFRFVDMGSTDFRKIVAWLKSLRPQPKQEWSEEDETIIEGACNALEIHGHTKLANKLKSLRPQPHWKPSEEQMKALAWYSGNYDIAPTGDKAIKSLYNDLKKLM